MSFMEKGGHTHCETYVFPTVNVDNGDFDPRISNLKQRKHTRSASYGQSTTGSILIQRDVTGERIHKPGHSRTRSHGQILDPSSKVHLKGNSRTDFILPPDHGKKDGRKSDGLFQRGHSRQASKTESIYTLRQTKTTSFLDRLCFWKKSSDEGQIKIRTVVPNHIVPPNTPKHMHPNKDYASNQIQTTKYTVLSFFPKNLFEQFHRFANLYFLFIVLLNWVPQINAFGKEIAMFPVLFVLGFTALKDAFEDRRRRHSDMRINNSFCRRYDRNTGSYQRVLWKDVSAGDILHLSCNEIIPADMLLLHSSDEFGLAYIESSNLDGESNLKQRQVLRGLGSSGTFEPVHFRSSIECDAPTTKIYKFHGSLINTTGQRFPVGIENLLLRDCILKNTDYVEGIVIYAGHETKAMLNNKGPRYKRSQLEKLMNTDVLWCVVILISLCFIGAVGSGLWLSFYPRVQTVPFLSFPEFSYNPQYNGFLTFWTLVIILQVLIPLSLYVTIEVVKIGQIYHIRNDLDLYDAEIDEPIECRALNISEELGQIKFLFSDKTGTLTENRMVFRRCTIGGHDYHHATDISSDAKFSDEDGDRSTFVVNSRLQKQLAELDIEAFANSQHTFLPNHRQELQHFFLSLATCNTVIVTKHPHEDMMDSCGAITGDSQLQFAARVRHGSVKISEISAREKQVYKSQFGLPHVPSLQFNTVDCDGDSNVSSNSYRLKNVFPMKRSLTPSPGDLWKPIYEAESPDELALVNAALKYNCRLLKRTPTHLLVSLPGQGQVDFEILKTLPFDSHRKRMSVILRHSKTKVITLYCKGADSSMFPIMLTKSTDAKNVIFHSQQQLNSYAQKGLRVLVMGKRHLSEEEYLEWFTKHQEIEVSLGDRDKKLRESYNVIEWNLDYLGATGVEDKLQKGVPETIASLRKAGINVWVLTGDKQETAINIAYSCKLFSADMEIITINARSKESAESTLRFYLNEMQPDQTKYLDVLPSAVDKKGLVIDGKTLIYILDPRTKLQKPFLDLCQLCTAVLCCRATPLQKAYIVKIVKERKVLTMAVGDGANDVSMIQTADVGVGISGKEGRQAVMASDFAIAKFRFLEKLLLVHGHWCYNRLARMVLYFFYKNAVFVFVVFWYQFYCGFSGTVMIDQVYLMLYNFMFTSLPPMAVGVYDKDASVQVLLSSPQLYSYGQNQLGYKKSSFWVNMLDALYQSLVIFYVTLFSYSDSDVDISVFGTTIVTACLFVNLLHLAVDICSWTWIHAIGFLLSIAAFIIFALLYNVICLTWPAVPNPYYVMQYCFTSPLFWLIILLASCLAVLPRFILYALKVSIKPDDVTQAVKAQCNESLDGGYLVSWSRSTSSSSVFRGSESHFANQKSLET